MADPTALREALAAFLGYAQYRKFVKQGVHRGRMRYWQEEAWGRFAAAHPELAVGPDELASTLLVCHLHGDVLQPDTAAVFHGYRDLAQFYVEARNRLFPHAAQDVASTEGRPFEGDRIGVLFCPSCRVARAEWEARRKANATEVTSTRHDIERLIEQSSIGGAGGVPMHVRRSAFASVADHPSFALALAHPVCNALIMVEPKSFFDRSRWPDVTKASIIDRLHDADSVVLLSFMTSDFVRTEHFTGGGISYDFVIHPKTYAVLHTALGSWRT